MNALAESIALDLFILLFMVLPDIVRRIFGRSKFSGQVTKKKIGYYHLRYSNQYVYRVWIDDKEFRFDPKAYLAVDEGDRVNLTYLRYSKEYLDLSIEKSKAYVEDKDAIENINLDAVYDIEASIRDSIPCILIVLVVVLITFLIAAFVP